MLDQLSNKQQSQYRLNFVKNNSKDLYFVQVCKQGKAKYCTKFIKLM